MSQLAGAARSPGKPRKTRGFSFYVEYNPTKLKFQFAANEATVAVNRGFATGRCRKLPYRSNDRNISNRRLAPTSPHASRPVQSSLQIGKRRSSAHRGAGRLRLQLPGSAHSLLLRLTAVVSDIHDFLPARMQFSRWASTAESSHACEQPAQIG